MYPAYVMPYIKTNKSDAKDEEVICEAASRPTKRFVPVKSVAQRNLVAKDRIDPISCSRISHFSKILVAVAGAVH